MSRSDVHRPDRRSLIAISCVIGALAAACASPGDPGVAIQELTADVVFGIEEPEPAPPANTDVRPVTQETGNELGDLTLPGFEEEPRRFRNAPASDGGEDECPTAPIGASPEEAAPNQVTSRPTAGLYRWVRDGEQTQSLGDSDVTTAFTGFERRLVLDVEDSSANDWTWQVAQPELGNSEVTVLTRYRVRTDAETASVDPSVDTGVKGRAGEPVRGVMIDRIQRVNDEGGVLSTFQPTNPIILAETPLRSGDSVTTVGIDPRTGETLRHEATTMRRAVVDACGTLLDGWLVESTQTYSGPGGQSTVSYDYIISTSFGGMVIYEDLSIESDDITREITYRVGQTEPDDPAGAPA